MSVSLCHVVEYTTVVKDTTAEKTVERESNTLKEEKHQNVDVLTGRSSFAWRSAALPSSSIGFPYRYKKVKVVFAL